MIWKIATGLMTCVSITALFFAAELRTELSQHTNRCTAHNASSPETAGDRVQETQVIDTASLPSNAPVMAATARHAQPAQSSETRAARATPSPLTELQLYGIESRVSALAKVVGITEEQRERLRTKYTDEARARRAGITAETPSLEEIIGEEGTRFYREQLSTAMERSQRAELDREVYYMARVLSLSQEQEEHYRELMQTVDSEIRRQFRSERESPQFQSDPSFRVKLSIRENEFRSKWLLEQLKVTLNPQQYEAYVKEEANSSSAELGVWHAS